MADPVKPPGLHVQVEAPEALNATVAPLPEQIEVGVAVAVIVGVGLTNSVTVLVFVQPPLEPVTEYVVVTVGETVTLAPINEPGIQVYVVAPDADKVALLPAQMTVGETEAVTVGVLLTVREMVRVLVHDPLDPVTV